MVLEEVLFEKKREMAVSRTCLNERCLAILNLHVAPMSPAQIQLNPTYCPGVNLVYLSLCVALTPPTQFRFNPSLNFGDDNVTLLWVL